MLGADCCEADWLAEAEELASNWNVVEVPDVDAGNEKPGMEAAALELDVVAEL